VAYIQSVLDAFPDHASTVDGVLVAGSAVTLEWTETGTHTEPYNTARFGTIPPTGQGFKAHVVEVFRFEGDEIASQNEYYDLMTMPLSSAGWLQWREAVRPRPPRPPDPGCQSRGPRRGLPI
jgi:hypothetical protein